MKNIPYLKWKEHLNKSVPHDHRLGTDVMLIENTHSINAQYPMSSPFKIDMSMALIFTEGSIRMRINMKEYEFVAPCVVVIVADTIYQIIETSENLNSKAVAMSKDFSNSLFLGYANIKSIYNSLLTNPVVLIDNDMRAFVGFFDLMLDLVKSSNSEFALDAARHLTLSMFYAYCANKQGVSDNSKIKSRQESICERFMELLSHYYKEQREVAFYAEKLCITPKYLSQIIKDQTDRTTLEYIEEYVVEESKALLISTTMSIQQISDELHFPSQSVFGKYFKRVTGMSPREYKNSSE